MSVTYVFQEVPTPVGPARIAVGGSPGGPVLVLGHGAGGALGSWGPDVRGAAGAAVELGLGVVLVDQPWRVAGRRVATAPARLDAAWLAVLAHLDRPHVAAGRSAGARVACRTATASGARAVLALAFPLVTAKGVSRAAELALPAVPVLVVQGEQDAFGVPPGALVVPACDHAFRADGRTVAEVEAEVRGVVEAWLAQTLT